ncbi:MAG TPA: hypothetical protein VHO47_00725 [Candidatus Babeliales bacterium]|nr:hypothetical protein [Candidatus Babeliales bacterium]
MRTSKLIILLFLISSSVWIGASHQGRCDNGPLIKPFSVTVRAGVAPSLFTDRGSVNVVVCPFSPPFFEVAKGQKFGDIWHNYAANVGVDFGYALCNNVELFGEFNYRRAKATNKSFLGVAPTGAFGNFFFDLDDFQEYAGYCGFRYFFNRVICERMAFFLGSKFGLVNYPKIRTRPLTIINATGISLIQDTVWFDAHTAVSGGLQVGFDYLICDWISLFFNAEIVASGSLKPFFNFVKADPTIFPNFTNLLREANGTLLSFPVNIGFRFYFG